MTRLSPFRCESWESWVFWKCNVPQKVKNFPPGRRKIVWLPGKKREKKARRLMSVDRGLESKICSRCAAVLKLLLVVGRKGGRNAPDAGGRQCSGSDGSPWGPWRRKGIFFLMLWRIWYGGRGFQGKKHHQPVSQRFIATVFSEIKHTHCNFVEGETCGTSSQGPQWGDKTGRTDIPWTAWRGERF